MLIIGEIGHLVKPVLFTKPTLRTDSVSTHRLSSTFDLLLAYDLPSDTSPKANRRNGFEGDSPADVSAAGSEIIKTCQYLQRTMQKLLQQTRSCRI